MIAKYDLFHSNFLGSNYLYLGTNCSLMWYSHIPTIGYSGFFFFFFTQSVANFPPKIAHLSL